jgi:predicted RNA-binding protein YlxR (DUF448 family)/ribosomal protein L30E
VTFNSSTFTEQDSAMSETGAESDARSAGEPQRRCLASGTHRPKSALLRFVVGPDGSVVFDVSERLPGRGLWLTPDRDMIRTAVSKRLFSRAARQSVTVPDNLEEAVASGLKRRCLDRLGLARRAGLVAAGFEKVQAQARNGRTALLLEATDGAADGRRKIQALAPDAPVFDLFTGAELGQAIGREHAVHVGLEKGGLTQALETDAARYAGVLGANRQDETTD